MGGACIAKDAGHMPKSAQVMHRAYAAVQWIKQALKAI